MRGIKAIHQDYILGRSGALLLKKGDQATIESFAVYVKEMGLLERPTVLVPIPGHEGDTNNNSAICEAIRKEHNNSAYPVFVESLLTCSPHESFHYIKQHNQPFNQLKVEMMFDTKWNHPETIEYWLKFQNIVLIDNVYDTGTTFRAAKKLIPNASMIVWTFGKNYGVLGKKENIY